jgi:hypothetical protein
VEHSRDELKEPSAAEHLGAESKHPIVVDFPDDEFKDLVDLLA